MAIFYIILGIFMDLLWFEHRPIGSDTIRSCGLIEDVALLEKVCFSHFLLPANLDIELSAPSLVPCLPMYHNMF